jgi:hypothetical protein
MKKITSDTGITVKIFYKTDGEALKKILRDSILLFIRGEVNKVCSQSSTL